MPGYNNLIIFDLDGVLIDSRELHYDALNDALETAHVRPISKEEHLSLYDGLPTTQKLKMLTTRKGLDPKLYDTIWQEKQKATIHRLKRLSENDDLIELFHAIKQMGYKIAVASNSVRETVKITLLRLGIMEYVDYYQTNEDTKRAKPHPEMYWNCMIALNAIPSTTTIIEDSHIGRQGAIDSGATLLAVENSNDVTYDKIMERLLMDKKEGVNIPWRDSKLTIVIPMAGAGSRFANAGYTFPKPLIEVRSKPMIQVVLENLNIEANYVFIVQEEHFEKYQLRYMLNLLAPNCKIVRIDGITEGAAATVLAAKDYINNDDKLMIVNSDQFLDWNSNTVMYAFSADKIDRGVVTFKSTHPKYSYVKLNDKGFAAEVVEKKVIPDMATVGFYYWTHRSDFVKYAEKMIAENKRQNGEFYVAPVYQEAIDDGKIIRVKAVEGFWSLGTPEDLNYFLDKHP